MYWKNMRNLWDPRELVVFYQEQYKKDNSPATFQLWKKAQKTLADAIELAHGKQPVKSEYRNLEAQEGTGQRGGGMGGLGQIW